MANSPAPTYDPARVVRQVVQRVDSGYATRRLDGGPGIAHVHAAFSEKMTVTVSSSGVTYEITILGMDRGDGYTYAFRGYANLTSGNSKMTAGEIEGYFSRGMDHGKINFITGPGSELSGLGMQLAELDADRHKQGIDEAAWHLRRVTLTRRVEELKKLYGFD